MGMLNHDRVSHPPYVLSDYLGDSHTSMRPRSARRLEVDCCMPSLEGTFYRGYSDVNSISRPPFLFAGKHMIGYTETW
jgi:hypothetical protein